MIRLPGTGRTRRVVAFPTSPADLPLDATEGPGNLDGAEAIRGKPDTFPGMRDGFRTPMGEFALTDGVLVSGIPRGTLRAGGPANVGGSAGEVTARVVRAAPMVGTEIPWDIVGRAGAPERADAVELAEVPWTSLGTGGRGGLKRGAWEGTRVGLLPLLESFVASDGSGTGFDEEGRMTFISSGRLLYLRRAWVGCCNLDRLTILSAWTGGGAMERVVGLGVALELIGGARVWKAFFINSVLSSAGP